MLAKIDTTLGKHQDAAVKDHIKKLKG